MQNEALLLGIRTRRQNKQGGPVFCDNFCRRTQILIVFRVHIALTQSLNGKYQHNKFAFALDTYAWCTIKC